MRRVAFLAIGVILVATACRPTARAPSAAYYRPTIILYGDSMMAQAHAQLKADLAASHPGARIIDRFFAGTALCDWLPKMQGADANIGATLVVMTFAGSWALSPCMAQADYVTETFLYWHQVIGLWVARGVQVVIGSVPPAVGETDASTAPWDLTQQIAHGVVNAYANTGLAHYANTGPAFVGAGGVYPLSLPCLRSEGPAQGCVNGMIRVRAEANNVHFYCQGLTPPIEISACVGYSSGILRWSRVVDRAARSLG